LSNYYRPSGFGGFSFFPPVIKNLLIMNGVIFLLQVIGDNIITPTGYTFGKIIEKYFALMPLQGFYDAPFYPWQLITYQFLHGGFSHVFFNMLMLWMFGMEIENQWGSKKFLIFYLMCGVVAGLAHMFISPFLGGGIAPVVGASGSIYGVLVAFAMMFPNRLIFLYFLFPIKAKYLIGILIAMEFLFVDSASSGVAHLAHLGGALAGFIYIIFDKRSNAEVRSMFTKTSYRQSRPFNPFGSMGERMKKKQDVEDAQFYEINDKEEQITQQQIDAILDKISQSGYQNLTEKEKKILFEASKKMK
jgi:membrane associated rhomboid family serine protease